MDLVEVDGLPIAYRRAGAGPPVVLLHGFVGDGAATWSAQLDALSADFTVVAWDAPGAGRSADPPESFRIADYARCLAGFLDALGLRRPHVVGLSFGGILALELFRTYPAVPHTLTLAGAYAGWAGSLPPSEVDARLARCLDLAGAPPDRFAQAMLPSMFSPTAPSDAVDRFAASVRATHPAGFVAMARASAEADQRDLLGRIDVPTLLLHGDADTRAPRPVADALLAAIPGARLVVLPGAGHASPVEAPGPFTAALRGFLG